jgi:hypothetical protein
MVTKPFTISYPFPEAEFPFVREVVERSDAVVEEFREVFGPKTDALKTNGFGALASYWYPGCSPERLAPVIRIFALEFILDDYVHHLSAEEVRSLKRRQVQLIDGAAITADDDVFGRQISLLRAELLALDAPDGWAVRLIDTYKTYIAGVVREQEFRNSPPSIAEISQLRHDGGGMCISTDLAEYAWGIFPPEHGPERDLAQRIKFLTGQMVITVNDLFSVAKDVQIKSMLNHVLVMQHELTCDLPKAYVKTVELHDRFLDEFLDIRARLTGPDARGGPMAGYIEPYCGLLQGNLAFHRQVRRYREYSPLA